MTKTEVAKLLATISAAYPRFEVDELKIKIWHEMLGDIEYQIASLAIKKCILSNTFAPSIAEVRQAATDIVSPRGLPAGEAWGEVSRVIKLYGHPQKEKAMAELSPLTAKVVNAIGWIELCQSEDPIGVVRGQFIKMYDQMNQREREQTLLPQDIRLKIEAMASKVKMIK